MPKRDIISGSGTGFYASRNINAHQKIKAAINNGLDRVRDGQRFGVDALAEKIAKSFDEDFLGTFKALSPFLPKDIFITSEKSLNIRMLSDDELMQIAEGRKHKVIDVTPSEPPPPPPLAQDRYNSNRADKGKSRGKYRPRKAVKAVDTETIETVEPEVVQEELTLAQKIRLRAQS